MTLDQFVAHNTGKAVTYDNVPADYGQCEQLVCRYWEDVLGFRCPMIPAAKDLWTNPTVLANFDRIPVGKEQKGDVAVWGASTAINSPEFGHTDIVLAPGFVGFDSNWGGVKASNGYPAAHEVQHNYTDVLGFLRKKGQTTVATDSLSKAEIQVIYSLAFDISAEATPADLIKAYTGKPLDGLLNQLKADPTYQKHVAKVNSSPAPVGYKPYSGPQLYTQG